MTTSLLASHHLLHLTKNVKDDDKLGGFRLIIISWVFSQLWTHWLHRHLMHLLGFCDLTDCITTWCISWVFVISLTASPPDASLGFLWSRWNFIDYITTWCISWVFMISLRFHWLHHHLMHLMGFYDLIEISLTTSPLDASPGMLWSH
jgi:hypothetical protein